MAKFVTGKELEELIYDIIFHAKKKLLIVSPFIKLDDYFKSLFEKHKENHELAITIVFGKNENNKTKSLNKIDLEYFSQFPNLTILYIPELHGKFYASDTKSVITSINLYDYSFLNNIEFGVSYEVNKVQQLTSIGADKTAYNHCFALANKADVIYATRPIIQSKLIGKNYRGYKVVVDHIAAILRNKSYEKVLLPSLPLTIKYSSTVSNERPQRENIKPPKKKSFFNKNDSPKQKIELTELGYCIRTGEEIQFNPHSPLSYDAFLIWAEYQDPDYPENYCHKTGKKSYGKTSFRYPILNDSFENKPRNQV